MVEEILPDIFKITVPLPDHAVRSVNSYIIASSDRALVIDTGWNRMACLETLLNAMEETGVDPTRADLFLTHIHADHAGLAGVGVVGGDRVLRPVARRRVDPQDLAERRREALGVAARAVLIAGPAAVAGADVEQAVGPELELPAVVV